MKKIAQHSGPKLRDIKKERGRAKAAAAAAAKNPLLFQILKQNRTFLQI